MDKIVHKRKYTSRHIKAAVGVLLFLLLVIVFASPWAYHFGGLAYVWSLLFGWIGLWGLIPFFSSLCWMMITSTKPKMGKGRFSGATIIAMVSLSILITHLANGGHESFSSLSDFVDAVSIARPEGSLYYSTNLGGGIVLYALTGLMNDIAGNWLVYLVFSISLFASICLYFATPLGILFDNIAKKASEARKQRRELEEAVEREMRHRKVQTVNEELIALGKLQPGSITDDDGEVVGVKRSDLHKEDLDFRTPKEVETPKAFSTTPSRPIASGLHKAVFNIGGEGDSVYREEPSVKPVSFLEEVFAAEEETKGETQSNEPEVQREETPVVEPMPQDECVEEEEPITEVSEGPKNEETPQETPTIPAYSAPLIEPEPAPAEEVEEEYFASEDEAEPELPPHDPKDDFMPRKVTAQRAYTLPSPDLLDEPEKSEADAEIEEYCIKAEQTLNAKLAAYKVGAYVVSHTIGPSVTRFDIRCNEDVSVTSIPKYLNDLSIVLGGCNLRFEPVVLGKNTSALEMSNIKTSRVYLRECLDALPKGYENHMYFPFGKSIDGEILSADLSDFPHMLIAGTSGSGKSVLMHSILLPLFMRNSPEDLRVLFIDPKHVELMQYKEIPHLLCPPISEPLQAKVALERLVDEMERRYKILEESCVSKISEFNTEYADEHGYEKIPQIVVAIDEYGDLTDSVKGINELILKLAAKARAAGIDIIIATQRPDVSVINGTIKANMQTRVALSMQFQQDSITILGAAGAEELIGKGDMLIDCGQIAKNGFSRCQGAYTTRKEIQRVVSALREARKVEYDPRFMNLEPAAEAFVTPSMPQQGESMSRDEKRAASDDEQFSQIVEWATGQTYVSVSMIQTLFRLGHSKALWFCTRLEQEGYVTDRDDPRNGTRGRYVLIHRTQEESKNPGSSDMAFTIPDGVKIPGAAD